MEATEVITSEVHKRIRDLDVDPRAEIQRSRELIRTVIAEYDERSLVADLPVLEDKEATFRHIDHQLSGFGALQDYFDDPHVEEIWVNSADRTIAPGQMSFASPQSAQSPREFPRTPNR